MRRLDLLAACIAVIGSSALITPPPAIAAAPPVIDDGIWGYCCTAEAVRCCYRSGCEVSQGECKKV